VIEVTAMIQKSIKTAGFLAVLFLFFSTGCAMGEPSRPLLWYGGETFPFEMILPEADHDNAIILRGERTPTSVTVTVTSPERTRGITVRYANGNCILTADTSEIPLSKSAAQGLTVLLDGLLLSSAEGAKLGSDAEGFPTVTFDSLTLTLDENGLPRAILHTETGRTAKITVPAEALTDQNNSEKTNKDQENNEHQNENNGGDF
jgi:hypothetical protein